MGHISQGHCCSVAQSCPTICDPMDCSTLGFPVLHHLPEFAQTHVHWVSDAIQPCLLPFPRMNQNSLQNLLLSMGKLFRRTEAFGKWMCLQSTLSSKGICEPELIRTYKSAEREAKELRQNLSNVEQYVGKELSAQMEKDVHKSVDTLWMVFV